MQSIIGFISDAHGNGPAFRIGIDLLKKFGAQKFYFLGDAIGYIPSPSVLDLILELGENIVCIRGNHEALLLDANVDADKDKFYRLEETRALLSSEHLALISTWPSSITLAISELDVLSVHGSPKDNTFGYVYPDCDFSQIPSEADWVFMGHTHRPFIREHAGTCYVNIGSSGLPRDDGRYGAVCVFDCIHRTARILRYDIHQESLEFLEMVPQVHPSVRSLFDRRSEYIYGDKV